jgi:hypothetical protein
LYLKDGKVAAVLACEREAQTARLIDAMGNVGPGLSRAQALAMIADETCAAH